MVRAVHAPPHYRLNFNKTDWQKFQDQLTRFPNSLPDNSNLSNDTIDTHLDTLNQTITEALQASTPLYFWAFGQL